MSVERRTRQRFPLNLELRFTAGKGGLSPIQGQGEVVNISSSGVAFRTETALTPDLSIDASMEWPVALNGNCVLRATMEGRVVRWENGLAVMSVLRHGFRTGGRVGTPANARLEALKLRIGSVLAPAAASHGFAIKRSSALAGQTAGSCLAAVSNSIQPRPDSPNTLRAAR